MSDRELLAKAAKACDPDVQWTDYSDRTPDHWVAQHSDRHWREWDPLTSDADAFRLAAHLFLPVIHEPAAQCVDVHGWACVYYSDHGGDRAAAARLAIVRAAAAIGEAMP